MAEFTLPKITKKMQAVIDKAHVATGKMDKVILEAYGVQLTRRHLACLAPGEWLNCEVINRYLQLIADRSKEREDLPNVAVMDSQFYPRLVKRGYWEGTPFNDVNYFKNDLVLIPINPKHEHHWGLACVDIRAKTIRYYDPLGGTNYKCLHLLWEYFIREMLRWANPTPIGSEWTLENAEEIPLQRNTEDCGVFVCKYAEFLSRQEPFHFTHRNMTFYRKLMIYEIMESDLKH